MEDKKKPKEARPRNFKRLTTIALFASLTAVGAQISIPIGSVPITLQMFFVFLAGFTLNPFDAFLSMLVYLVLGAVGLPVFANLSGGIIHLIGPTSGYLWAFPISAFVISWLSRRTNAILSGLLGLVVVYLIGWTVLGFHIGSYKKAFLVGVLPFIFLDALKLAMSYFVALKTRKILGGSAYGQA